MVLTTMKITKALDEKGVPIEAEVKYEFAMLRLALSRVHTGWVSRLITVSLVTLFLLNVRSLHARRRP